MFFKAFNYGKLAVDSVFPSQDNAINQQPAKKTGHRFVRGVSGNPAGRPVAGLQSFKDRLAWWMETKTIGDIEAIIENEKKWNKLLSVDAMVARRISQAAKAHGKDDFVALLDRLLGKPAQTAEVSVTHGLADRLNKAESIINGSGQIITTNVVVPLIAEGDDEKASSINLTPAVPV